MRSSMNKQYVDKVTNNKGFLDKCRYINLAWLLFPISDSDNVYTVQETEANEGQWGVLRLSYMPLLTLIYI